MHTKLPNKHYSILYADPPWDFKGGGVYQDSGRPVRETKKQYKLTKTKDLKLIPIQDIINKDALIFMWTTDQHLKDAISLMEAWGFRYCTVAFYWVKHYESGSPCYNVGCWTMKSVEQVLLGLHGKPMHLKKRRNVKQLVESIRTIHSRKPDEVRNRITDLVGDVPKIELFAREVVPGWDAWGDQVPGQDSGAGALPQTPMLLSTTTPLLHGSLRAAQK